MNAWVIPVVFAVWTLQVALSVFAPTRNIAALAWACAGFSVGVCAAVAVFGWVLQV